MRFAVLFAGVVVMEALCCGTASPAYARDAEVAPSAGPAARAHVASDRPVSVEMRRPGERRWTVACQSPCDQDLSLSYDYRIVGTGVKRSGAFQLDGGAGQRVEIGVQTGTKLGYYGGASLLVVGIAGLTFGALLMVWTTLPFGRSNGGETVAIGGASAAVGAGGIIAGAFMMAGNRTSVNQGSDARGSVTRSPTWHDRSVVEAAMPEPTRATLVSFSF